jgi:hypothetical protein
MTFTPVPFWAILAAAVVAWLFGAAYYGALSKPWLRAVGIPMEQMKRTGVAAALPFVLSFLAELLMAYVLAGLIGHVGATSLRGGAISGLFVWAGFVATTIAVNNAYPGRPWLLTLIDAGHWLGVLVVMGGVMGWAAG